MPLTRNRHIFSEFREEIRQLLEKWYKCMADGDYFKDESKQLSYL